MTDVLFSALVDRLHPCGPVINDQAAGYVMETLYDVARAEGWRDVLQQAEPALRPVIAASPYLAGIMKRDPQRLRETLITPPEARLRAILLAAEAIEQQALTVEIADLGVAKKVLRHLKAECHLLTALADLGDVWSLDHVTAALTRFADAVTSAALALVVREESDKGRLEPYDRAERGVLPGMFVLAMGKHGAGELN